MSFYQQYELQELIPGGTVKTFKARQIATGRDVRVHLIVSNSQSVLRQVKALVGEKRSLVIDHGEDSGTTYVVTAPLPGGVNFEQWLNAPGVGSSTLPELQRVGQWDVTKLHPSMLGQTAPP